MGFAAGMRAGQLAAESAYQNYLEARKNREIREMEKGLQQTQADRQAEADTYQQNLDIAQQQPQPLLQQQQMAEAGLGPAVNPQQSLVAQPAQPLMPGQVAAGPMSVSGQAVGLGAAPTAYSDIQLSDMRAAQLRGLGYVDEAMAEEARSAKLRAEEREIAGIERQAQRDAENDRRWAMDYALSKGQDERDAEMHAQNLALITGQLEDLNYNRGVRRQVAEAYDKFSGMDVVSLYDNKEFNALPAPVRDAVMGTMANIEKTKLDATHTYLRNKSEELGNFTDLKVFIDGDETLTKGTYYRAEPSKDGKGFELQLMYDDGTPAGETQVWDNETQADEYLRTLMTDKLSATRLYAAQRQQAEDREAAANLARSKGRMDANKYIADMEQMMADTDNMYYAQMSAEELRAERQRLYGHLVTDGFITQEGFDRLVNMKRDIQGDEPSTIMGILKGLTDSDSDSAPADKQAPSPARENISPAAEAAATGLRGLGTAGGFVVDSLTLPFRYGGMATEAAYDATTDFVGDTAAALRRPRDQ